jgi:Ca-activated chloride channel family protein
VDAQKDAGGPPAREGPFRFKSGVDLINITATVTDTAGRFVPGFRKEDFVVYEDNQLVELTYFSAERVPVSLGIALDTSGSMAGTKIQEARTALDRFLYDLLDKDDEVLLYRFSDAPVLLQEWTTARQPIARALERIAPNGGTALYDAVSEAIPAVQQGQFRKKALLVISDGNDTSSRVAMPDLKRQIRESDVLVYAVGIDGVAEEPFSRPTPQRPRPPVFPVPFPPGGGRGRYPPFSLGPQGGGVRNLSGSERVNVEALRSITDDSGGRTEVIRDPRDLNAATANIADELRRQYAMAYQALAKKDGRWHSIRVEIRNGRYVVRARTGYIAS